MLYPPSTRFFSPLSPEACAALLRSHLDAEFTTGLLHGIVVRDASPTRLKLRIAPRPGPPRRLIPWGLKARLTPFTRDGMSGTAITGTVEPDIPAPVLISLPVLVILFFCWLYLHGFPTLPQLPLGIWSLVLYPLIASSIDRVYRHFRPLPSHEYTHAAHLFLWRILDASELPKDLPLPSSSRITWSFRG